MDTYGKDAAVVANHLDLHDSVHIGHSTGGGEVARDVAKYGEGRVAKAVLISAVPPLMLKTESNPEGTPIEVFDGFREGTAFNRAQFFSRRRLWSVLRIQSSRSGCLPRCHSKLVAPGHDGRRQCSHRGH
jgi:pimeloyl-ACP methyl ester carboxylesterase